jgi:DNA-binding NarL/FixJ family response regulator
VDDPTPAVAIVSRDRLFATAAATYLGRRGWHASIVTAEGIAALTEIGQLAPLVVLATDDDPRLRAPQLASLVRRRLPGVRVVILGDVSSSDAVVVSRDAEPDDVLEALTKQPSFDGRQAPRRDALAALAELTRQERVVLQLITDGVGPADIASRLSLSTHTVRTHTQRLHAKLGCHSRSELIAFAAEAGLLRPA